MLLDGPNTMLCVGTPDIIPSLPLTTNTEMGGEKQGDAERLVSRSRMHSH